MKKKHPEYPKLKSFGTFEQGCGVGCRLRTYISDLLTYDSDSNRFSVVNVEPNAGIFVHWN